MNTLPLTSVISRNPEAVYTEIEQEMVMLEPKKAVFCHVNPIGTVLWSLLDGKVLSLDALCNHIHQQYDVTHAQCVEDVRQFINEMVALNLLVVTHSTTDVCI